MSDLTFAQRFDAMMELARSLSADMECRSPAYGAPGIPHCAACCGGTMVLASSKEEFDFANALSSMIRAADRYVWADAAKGER